MAAWAQTAPAPTVDAAPATPTSGLEDLTVTARRQAESLQTVPLSVTDIPKSVLDHARPQTLNDLLRLTPGVNITDDGSEFGGGVTIRGVTDESFGVAPPATASFLDGVFLRDPQAINVPGDLLQRVEIIKGPVSALYGRDAYAGVINYVTQRPTDEFHGDISQTFGNDGNYQTNVSVSGAAIPGKVDVKLFGTYSTFNGTDHTPITGTPGGAYDKKDIGALVDVHVNDHITTQFNFYFGYDQFGQSDIVRVPGNCDYSTFLGTYLQYCGKITHFSPFMTNFDPISGAIGNKRRMQLASVKTDAVYDWGKIESITAATHESQANYAAFDISPNGIPFPLTNGTSILEHGYYGGDYITSNFSQELRYSSPPDRRLRYGGGVYYYRENRETGSVAGLPETGIPAGVTFAPSACFGLCGIWATPTGAPGTNFNETKQITDEEAAFASGEFDILPTLTISTQYRYTDQEQLFSTVKNQYNPNYYPDGPHISSTAQYFNTNNAIRWQATPNVMAYFAQANGTKPGGYNGASTVAADVSFGPESDMSYEGGLKTNFFGNRLQLDTAIYHISTQNTQAYGPSSDPSNAAYVIKNFGGSHNLGAEADLRAKPIQNTIIGLGVSYNHAVFDSNTFDLADAGTCGNVPSCAATLVQHGIQKVIPIGGHSVPYAPQFTMDASVEYDFTLMDKYDGFARFDYTLKSKVFSDPSNLTSIGVSNEIDLNAGIAYGNYSLAAFIKNVANDRTPEFFNYQTQLNYFETVPAVVLPQGRTFGAILSAHF